MSHNLQIFGKFTFFEDLQMIEKPCLAKSNGIELGKKWSSPPSMCKGVLGLSNAGLVSGVQHYFESNAVGNES